MINDNVIVEYCGVKITASLGSDGKFGILKNNKQIIPNIYEYINYYEDVELFGCVKEQNNIDVYCIINSYGEKISDDYDYIVGFENQVSVVMRGGKDNVIDKHGNELLDIDYDYILSANIVDDNIQIICSNDDILYVYRYVDGNMILI